MHLTRPKSSKGRNRPTLSHNPPITPKPPTMGYDRSDQVPHSHSFHRQTSQQSTDNVTDLLQNIPAAPSPSLNKYKVLPSIEKKPLEDASVSGMEEKTSKLSLSDNLILQARPQEHHLSSGRTRTATRSNPEMGSVVEVQCRVWSPDPDTMTIEPESPSSVIPQGSLLLAIRAPCGRRFQHHFPPTDSLLTVIANAEARYGTRYEYRFIETMDVPRRTFTNLNLTLAQCGIVNRSVLCISQEDCSMDTLNTDG